METLNSILLHFWCLGTEYEWHWHFPLFFFLIFLFMFFVFIRWRRRYNSHGWPHWSCFRDYDRTDAIDILKKRYAQGNITKEEYDRIMKDIS